MSEVEISAKGDLPSTLLLHDNGPLTPYGTPTAPSVRHCLVLISVVVVEIRSGQTTATRSELNYETTSRAPKNPSEE